MLAALLALLLTASMLGAGPPQRAAAQGDAPMLESSAPFAGQLGVPTDPGLQIDLVFDRDVASESIVDIFSPDLASSRALLADDTIDDADTTISLTVGDQLAAGTQYVVSGTAVAADDPDAVEEFAVEFVTALDDELQFGLVEPTPPNAALEVPVDLAEVVAVFNHAVSPQLTPSLSLTGDGDEAEIVIDGEIDGDTATFVLDEPLHPDRGYTAQLVEVASDHDLEVVDETLTWSFRTEPRSDDGLTLVASTPADGDQHVRTDLGTFTARFDRDLDPDVAPVLTMEVLAEDLLVLEGVEGVLDATDPTRVVFDLVEDLGKELPANRDYTVTIAVAAADAPGERLEVSVSFRTSGDDGLLLLTSSPADGARDVGTDLGSVTARFNRELDTANPPVLQLDDADGPVLVRSVVGEFSHPVHDDRVSFDLTGALAADLVTDTEYRITINAAAADTPADRRDFPITFTTGTPGGITLTGSDPADGADDVAPDVPSIIGEFNVPIDQATVTLISVGPRLTPIVPPELTQINVDDPRMVLLPLDGVRLAPGERYEATFDVASGAEEARAVIAFDVRPPEGPALHLEQPFVWVGDPLAVDGTGFEPSTQVEFTLREPERGDDSGSDTSGTAGEPAEGTAGSAGSTGSAGSADDSGATQQPAAGTAVGQPRIFNGTPASIADVPWVVMIESTRGTCTGSVVTSRWVLTAAHCVETNNPASLRIGIGGDDLDVGFAETHSASRIVRHPGYRPQTLFRDIALIELSTPTAAPPVNLAAAGVPDYAGQMATVTGWGALRNNPDGTWVDTDLLQRASVLVREHSVCLATYAREQIVYDPSTYVCAGGPTSDACSGDSGGPLLLGEGTDAVQIGIVSSGEDCTWSSSLVGAYTAVAAYRTWIDETIASAGISLGQVTTDADGTFRVELPTASLSPGEYLLVATEASPFTGTASASVQLNVDSEPERDDPREPVEAAVTEELASTGADGVVLLTLLGVLAALLGAAMVLASRREDRPRSGAVVVFTARCTPR